MTLGLPPRAVRTLREIYASPLDPAYWDQLQRRINARIAAEPALGVVRVTRGPAWDAAFRAWARVGLIAAGIAIVCAGAMTWQANTADAQAAYETVLSSSTAAPSSWLAEVTGSTDARSP